MGTNLDVAKDVVLDGGEGNGAQGICGMLASGCRSTVLQVVPKMVVRDSAASRNSVVRTALPLASSIGTSTKDLLKVDTMVLPGGMTGADIIGRLVVI